MSGVEQPLDVIAVSTSAFPADSIVDGSAGALGVPTYL
jgi:hypothetical protein